MCQSDNDTERKGHYCHTGKGTADIHRTFGRILSDQSNVRHQKLCIDGLVIDREMTVQKEMSTYDFIKRSRKIRSEKNKSKTR